MFWIIDKIGSALYVWPDVIHVRSAACLQANPNNTTTWNEPVLYWCNVSYIFINHNQRCSQGNKSQG